MKGQIIKAVASKFNVKVGDNVFYDCVIRGTVKKAKEVYVGDYCEVEDNVITALYPRKNEMIRPYVANIDALLVVVAPVPKPDWICVEKLILNCHHQNILPAIVLNKIDLCTQQEADAMLAPYKNEFTVFSVSAATGEGIGELKDFLDGKLVCFAGQSAVGKSSLINVLGEKDLEVGALSKKISRGKNTTRHVEIYDLDNGRAVDTCGFSVMDSVEIKYDELVYYYDEFLAFQQDCRYTNCTHTNEPNCAVKKAVEEGKIDRSRYERYRTLYEALKENWLKKY